MEAVKKPFITVYDLCTIALGAALLAVCAWISIPTAIPFTLQTFAVFLVTGLLGLKRGTLAVVIYLLLGAVGLPVFAGFKGGPAALIGITGGYLLGFIFSALAVGLITKFFGRRIPVLVISMIIGLVLCYAFGSVWFMVLYIRSTGPITMGAVLMSCVVPYLLPDAVKIALAVLLVDRLKNIVH